MAVRLARLEMPAGGGGSFLVAFSATGGRAQDIRPGEFVLEKGSGMPVMASYDFTTMKRLGGEGLR